MVVSFLIAAALSASQAAPAATPAVTANQKMICKSIKITGTRLGKERICRTKAAWDLESREHSKDAQDLQNSSTRVSGGG